MNDASGLPPVEAPFAESFATFLDWASPAELVTIVTPPPAVWGVGEVAIAVEVFVAAAIVIYSRTLKRE